jgi:DNA-directed RNA polymerase subunit RPC12/RpoP
MWEKWFLDYVKKEACVGQSIPQLQPLKIRPAAYAVCEYCGRTTHADSSAKMNYACSGCGAQLRFFDTIPNYTVNPPPFDFVEE